MLGMTAITAARLHPTVRWTHQRGARQDAIDRRIPGIAQRRGIRNDAGISRKRGELYFSIIQRKVLTPNDCTTLHELMERIIAFGKRYSALGKLFAWTFTRQDLERRLREPLLQSEPLPLATAA